MSLASDAAQLVRYIRDTSKEAAIQEAVNDLQIKIGDLAQERLELIDTIADLKAKLSELEEAAAEKERMHAQLDQYRSASLAGGIPCYVHCDEKDAISASKRYCPQCYENSRLQQLSGVFTGDIVSVNCSECGWSAAHI